MSHSINELSRYTSPWLGFFYKMNNCETLVLLDNVKHSKSSVAHRKIKANDKELMLTIPLANKESLINELVIHEPDINLRKLFSY